MRQTLHLSNIAAIEVSHADVVLFPSGLACGSSSAGESVSGVSVIVDSSAGKKQT